MGFDDLEQRLQAAARTDGKGYPPFNVETPEPGELRITLAVAGFARQDLTVTVENRELIIRGTRDEGTETVGKVYLHRGIATRRFLRRFVLADGVRVTGASLDQGLLHIEMREPNPEPERITIEIR